MMTTMPHFIKMIADTNAEGKSTKRKGRDTTPGHGGMVFENKLVKAKDIARKIKSFDHFLYVWGHTGGYYMPPKSVFTWHYVSQILAQEKRLLKVSEVGHVLEVPKVRGSVVNEIYHKEKLNGGLAAYFPDFTETQNVPRDYFFNVKLIRSLRW